MVITTVALKVWPELGLGEEGRREYVMARVFHRFRSELTQVEPPKAIEGDNADSLEQLRLKEYTTNRGLFLGHYWRPSEQEGQVADIRIQLRDHPDPDGGPTVLEEGKVLSVTYQLGPKFSREPITERNSEDNFALDVSAYGPVLCLAEVHFNDGTEHLRLSRYIDFPEDLQTAQPRPWWRRLIGG